MNCASFFGSRLFAIPDVATDAIPHVGHFACGMDLKGVKRFQEIHQNKLMEKGRVKKMKLISQNASLAENDLKGLYSSTSVAVVFHFIVISRIVRLLASVVMLLALLESVGKADTTNFWSALAESAQTLAINYAKTNYPQYFPEVPLLKRTEFNLLSPTQELEIGNDIFQHNFTNPVPSELAAGQKRVNEIGLKLAAAAKSYSNAPPLACVYRVVDCKDFNATCYPGGNVTVNSGVLSFVRSDDELSFVIGHEIGHAFARHAGETITREILRKKGMEMMIYIAQWAEQQKHIEHQTGQITLELLNEGSVLTVSLPHKRSQEVEADHLGLLFMAKAGFNPQSAVDLWQRMASTQSDTNSPLSLTIAKYCSDHPPDAERVANLKVWLDEEKIPGQSSNVQFHLLSADPSLKP